MTNTRTMETSQERPKPSQWAVAVPLTIVGTALGFLLGLSESAVVGLAITSLLAAAAAVMSVSRTAPTHGVRKSDGAQNIATGETADRAREDAAAVSAGGTTLSGWILAALAIGICSTAPIGIRARTAAWFAPTIDAPPTLREQVDEWVALGIERDEVVRAMFARRLDSLSTPQEAVPARSAGLHSKDDAFCLGYGRGTPAATLRESLSSSSNLVLRALATHVRDNDELRLALDDFCRRVLP